jgi:tRNA A-37 threonylcarbamoyl transferase component Bud32
VVWRISSMTDLSGQMLGRYRVNRLIGEGGMALVFTALDTILEREVAIKLIRTDAFPPSQLALILKRFEHEAKFMARMSHGHIVKVYDYGEYHGAPYLVMEYHSGGTLKDRLGKPHSYQEAVKLILPVARALVYAHKHNMMHRDVKPANILIDAEGEPMLSDFGIAKLLELDSGYTLTGTGVGIGTPEYMAPEQGLCRKVDGRADIYALGVILFELISGKKPFTADTPMAVIFKHVNEPIPDLRHYVPDLPPAVIDVLNTMMAKDPEDRYPDTATMAAALESLLNPNRIIADLTNKKQESPMLVLPDQTIIEPQVNSNRIARTYLETAPAQQFPEPKESNKFAALLALFRSRKMLLPGGLVIVVLIIVLAFTLFQPEQQGSGMGGKSTITVVAVDSPVMPVTGGNTEVMAASTSTEVATETLTATGTAVGQRTKTQSNTLTPTHTPTLPLTPQPGSFIPTRTQDPALSSAAENTATVKPTHTHTPKPTNTATPRQILLPTDTPASIFRPTATKPLILKPTATSPIILKPTATTQIILKPTATSPIIIKPSATSPVKK